MQHHRLRSNPRDIVVLFGAVAATVLLAGCATPSSSDKSAEPREERTYRTGSNLPQRDTGGPSDVKTVDPASIKVPARGTGSPTTGSGG